MTDSKTVESLPTKPPKLPSLRAWLIGILFLLALFVVVTNLGEIEHFAQLAQEAKPAWLLAAILLQAITYVCAAAVWWQTLRYAGVHYSIWRLVPLGFAKLFSDQVLPSAGVSGITFFVTALNRRGVPTQLCMAAVLVNIVSYYIAFVLVALLSLGLLWFYHAVQGWITIVAVIFGLFAVAIPSGTLWFQQFGQRTPPRFLLRVPRLSNLLQAFADAPTDLLHTPSLILITTLFQLAVFLADSATLWVMLQAVGQKASFLAALPGFIIAAMVATIGLVPLGLGTFEATSVALLSTLGTPVEAALTATLLLRGFTLWLPMLPGLWFTRRELN